MDNKCGEVFHRIIQDFYQGFNLHYQVLSDVPVGLIHMKLINTSTNEQVFRQSFVLPLDNNKDITEKETYELIDMLLSSDRLLISNGPTLKFC